MQHHFSTEIAKDYDIITAILLDNFYYWIEKNKLNERNFKDGRYWTYNTKKAIVEWFPYLNERQLDYALKKMVEQGLLIKGNYNENKYDRTLWYAITDFGYSILQNCKMYNIQDTYTHQTTTNTNTKTTIKENFIEAIINEFDFSQEVRAKIIEWLEYKKEKKQSYKEKGLRAFCKQRFEEVNKYDESYVIEMIDYSMCQNYSGVFAPKQKKPEAEKPRYGNYDMEDVISLALRRTYGDEDLVSDI